MTSPGFVHLHVHTAYSLLDGAIRMNDLVRAAGEHDLPAVAVTDHGNMFGVLELYKAAKAQGIKPIIGVEAYVAPRGRRRRDPADPIHHLVLLARDYEGYRNLTRLVSLANMEGFYYKPRVDLDLLREHNRGLVALSGCLQGGIPQAVLAGRDDWARAAAEEYAAIFPDRFYLEIQKNFLPEQDQVNEALIDLSRNMGLPLVATNDCHYLRRQDADAHDVLLCIQTGKTVDEENRMRMTTQEYYFKSPDEMARLFADTPEALANTLDIASSCELEIPMGDYHFPEFELENGESLEGRLQEDARRGLEARLNDIRQTRGLTPDKEQEYRDRLEYELDVIIRMGFPGYFLIVADFINYARDNGIPVGPGRGSAAGSLVAYALRITDIDPLPYGLLFERFLNVERISMPDIDIDFCTIGREEVIRYVTQKYGGQERVAQIITFGQMQARAVIRDVGRALGLPYGEVDRIAKLVPNRLKITLDEALQEEPRLEEAAREDERIARLLEAARALEALPRHASTHAAGVVIGDRPLVDYLPLYCVSQGSDPDAERVVVTQFDMKGVEKIGLIKFDFLGLKTLTLIANTLELLKNRGVEIDMDRLEMDDGAAFELLGRGNTTGVFQLESSGMREILIKMKPNRFEDIIALVALYRPGPLKSGMVDDFINRKHGREKVEYPLPELEPILKETYGVILYQEQVMQISSRLANYSLGEADLLRRAMGKKIASVMDEQRGRFMEGAGENSIDPAKAAYIFDLMANFAEYGFNKSHSAAYALISYQTAYLKANYPVEFMAALLTSETGAQDKIVRLIAECREQGLTVLPPDINESRIDFTVIDGQIRFGMAAIKGVGQAAIEAILQAREDKPFANLFEFCERVDLRKVNRRVVEALIKCGAFDSTGAGRSQMAAALDDALDRGSRMQKERVQGQNSLFDVLGEDESEVEIRWPDVPEWRESLRLSSEKEALGFYITGHPLARYEKELETLANTDTEKIKDAPDKAGVRLGGVVSGVTLKMTKKGERMAFVTLEDMYGLVELLVFPSVYESVQDILVQDAAVLVNGEVTVDEKSGSAVVKVKAKEMAPLESAIETMAGEVVFTVDAAAMQRPDLLKLKTIVEGHRGRTPAVLRMELPGRGRVVYRLETGVRPSKNLLRDAREALGESSVVFRYPENKHSS